MFTSQVTLKVTPVKGQAHVTKGGDVKYNFSSEASTMHGAEQLNLALSDLASMNLNQLATNPTHAKRPASGSTFTVTVDTKRDTGEPYHKFEASYYGLSDTDVANFTQVIETRMKSVHDAPTP
jgi:hypothetical protein